jgi:hypothetical protein
MYFMPQIVLQYIHAENYDVTKLLILLAARVKVHALYKPGYVQRQPHVYEY